VTQSPQNVRRLEEKLLQQQALLERSMLTAVEQGRQTVADETQDVADQAVSSYQKELLFTQGTNGHAQLSLIRLALERVNEGTYGDVCTAETLSEPNAWMRCRGLRIASIARKKSKTARSKTLSALRKRAVHQRNLR